MNRNNFFLHLGLAAGLIALAAFAGALSRMDFSLDNGESSSEVVSISTVSEDFSEPTEFLRVSDSGEPEVLVKFRDGISREQIEKLVSANHDRIEDKIESVDGLYSIDDLDDVDAENVAREYSLSGAVVYAEPNLMIKLDPNENLRVKKSVYSEPEADSPDDPMFSEQWALNNSGQNNGKSEADIRALDAWKKTKGSDKVVIAVLDSGVDYNHADLASNMWTRPDSIPEYQDAELGSVDDFYGFDAEDAADPMDDNGHGTHCAGVIGAEADNGEGIAGINWKVEIMPLKFLGRGGFGSTKNAIEAINYVIDRKKAGVNVRVISASWGSTSKSKALEDVIRKAGEEGILFVAAAGNDSSNNDKRPHYPSNYNLPNVISVAALDRNDDLAKFSNYGEKTVHIAAPGKDIVSTWLGQAYREASGTSMAAPQISGVAGLILSMNPKISVEKLREKILKSVDKLDSLKGKIESGGRINAAKAVGN